MADKYDELERLARAATLGPWEVELHGHDSCESIIAPKRLDRDGKTDPHYVVLAGADYGVQFSENAVYIAAANPAVVLDLIAELRAKDARIQALEASIRFANAARQAKE